MEVANFLKAAMSHLDNDVDAAVNKAIAALESDPDAFAEKWRGLDLITRKGLQYMVKEQIGVEQDPERKARLESLQAALV